MLRADDNLALTSIDPGSLMGDLLRRYWMPIYTSAHLPAGGRPERVRILGEDLVVFRQPNGEVGLLQAQCAHRGAPLTFARNEDDGLRCVWHGWKYDRQGSCLEMKNEPPHSAFKSKIQLTSYECRERNGVVWAYMGPGEAPALPHLEWNELPAEHVYISLRVQRTNWFGCVEGEFDSSHAMILHGGISQYEKIANPRTREIVKYRLANPFPSFQAVDSEYGVLIGARYRGDEESDYWRIYPFLMPFYTIVNVNPAGSGVPMFSGHAWVPIDNETTLAIGVAWHPERALTSVEIDNMKNGLGFANGSEHLMPSVNSFLPPTNNKPYRHFWPKLDYENDFGFDYEAQAAGVRFSGIPHLWLQDYAVAAGYGPVNDRSKEHLGSADLGQIAIRRRMVRAARALRENGIVPRAVADPTVFPLRPTEMILPKGDTDWVTQADTRMRSAAVVL